jgi:hypothetical protein
MREAPPRHPTERVDYRNDRHIMPPADERHAHAATVACAACAPTLGSVNLPMGGRLWVHKEIA